MSGDVLTYPTDSAVTADDFVATEKVSGGRVFRQRANPENLKVRATGSSTETTLAGLDQDTQRPFRHRRPDAGDSCGLKGHRR